MKAEITEKVSWRESIALYRRIGTYFVPYKFNIFVSVLAMVLVSAATAGSAYLIKPALDDIFINKDLDALAHIPLAYLALVLAKGLGRYLQSYFMSLSAIQVSQSLRIELFHKLLHLPVGYFETTQVGSIMARFAGDVALIQRSLPASVMMVRQGLTMLGLLCVVFYQNSELALWATLVLPVTVLPLLYFGRKMRKFVRRNQKKGAYVSGVLQEVLSGVRVIKAFATEDREVNRYKKENLALLRLAMKQVKLVGLSSPIMELLGAIGIGLVISVGGAEVIAGTSTPGTFFSFMAAIIMMYDPVKSYGSSNQTIQGALVGAERVFAILDAEKLAVESSGTLIVNNNFKELSIENLNFKYPDGTPALKDINLHIRAGEQVAIVGPSGAGKTTLVNLIPRFYEPSSGGILLNGHALPEYDLYDLRRNIAVVSQDAFLFNVSARDNIAYGAERAVTNEEIFEAAKFGYADEFIKDLSDGYNTILGERGVKLSGGQKQRLTIARALLKDAPLLILDEATSALDSQAERIVQKALDNLMQDRTSIVIAHRLSTILNADRIVVMEDGQIVDVGSHSELLNRCELYTRLYTIQYKHEQKQENSVEHEVHAGEFIDVTQQNQQLA